jgi:hypothetical protein
MQTLSRLVIGWLAGLEATNLYPHGKPLAAVLSAFILNPIVFLEGAVFLLVGFLYWSRAIQLAAASLSQKAKKGRRRGLIYGMIIFVLLLVAWISLLVRSVPVSLILLALAATHAGLSFEKTEGRGESGRGWESRS